MQRKCLQELQNWQKQSSRKPLLLDGARQVGKTYLIEYFGAQCFTKVHKLDFLANPRLIDLFEEGLDPAVIISKIEIYLNVTIDLINDMIFFDEIGECQAALDSLKYFAENLPQAYICASGSNIGLLGSFPVGKVHLLALYPMDFEEFLWIYENMPLNKAYVEQARNKLVHDQLWKILLDYYFVGGMPEAVKAWSNKEKSIQQKCMQVSDIHKDLIVGYQRDFAKYKGQINAQHIETVFLNVPRQLSKNFDGSVKRFVFKGVIEKKNRYADLRGPIDWLVKAKLISKCYPIDSQPRVPLQAQVKENSFKLYFFDVGLLGHLLEMNYTDQQAQKTAYKGYIAENFVQNEFRANGTYPSYSWELARGEIEFLLKSKNGEIVPVEVKSGARTRAKSLQAYIDRYKPTKSVKLIGAVGGNNEDKTKVVWPLYYAQFLKTI